MFCLPLPQKKKDQAKFGGHVATKKLWMNYSNKEDRKAQKCENHSRLESSVIIRTNHLNDISKLNEDAKMGKLPQIKAAPPEI